MLRIVIRASAYFFSTVQCASCALIGAIALQFIARPTALDLAGIGGLFGLTFVGAASLLAMRLSPFADDVSRPDEISTRIRDTFRTLAWIGGAAQVVVVASQLAAAAAARRLVLEWLLIGPICTFLTLWFSRTTGDRVDAR